MFRHIVVFRWKPEAEEGQIAAALAALIEWKSVAAEHGILEIGIDSNLAADNGNAAVTVDFRTLADYVAYAEDPRHISMIEEFIKPVVAQRLAVQYDV